MSEQARSAAAHGRQRRAAIGPDACGCSLRVVLSRKHAAGNCSVSMFGFIGRETIPPVSLTINDVHGQRCLCLRARGPIYLDQPTNFLSFNSQLANQAKQISQVAKTLEAFLLIRKGPTMQ